MKEDRCWLACVGSCMEQTMQSVFDMLNVKPGESSSRQLCMHLKLRDNSTR